MTFTTEFDLKQEVYLKTDIDKMKRIITGITIRENLNSYELSCIDKSSWHYAFEILSELPINGNNVGFKK